MKTKSKLLVGFAIAAALIVGFLTGLLVEYPIVDNDELSGTIGRISNYRNTKVSEADIELRNELLSDTILQKTVKTYMSFYYGKSLAFANTISFAVDQAKTDQAFAAEHSAQIEAMRQFGVFLETSRKDFLMAALVCDMADDTSPDVLRNTITQAYNLIAQMNHQNSMVLSFIKSLESHIRKTGNNANDGLNRAHDLLVINQISASAATSDKAMLKYFDKKQLFTSDIQLTPTDVKGSMVKDMTMLNEVYPADMEKLLLAANEKLGLKDSEKLGFMDGEKLGMFLDNEKLGLVNDVEMLGMGFFDAEKLGGIICLDAEKLGAGFTDTEKLGAGFTDSEKLGTGFTDAEALRGISDWIN